MSETCQAKVSGYTGYHFSKCGKPAKWRVGDRVYCGIHARLDNWRVKGKERVLIATLTTEAEGSK